MIRAKPRPQSMTGAPFYFIAKLIYIDLILYPNYLALCFAGLVCFIYRSVPRWFTGFKNSFCPWYCSFRDCVGLISDSIMGEGAGSRHFFSLTLYHKDYNFSKYWGPMPPNHPLPALRSLPLQMSMLSETAVCIGSQMLIITVTIFSAIKIKCYCIFKK